jgi:hypothetical protein
MSGERVARRQDAFQRPLRARSVPTGADSRSTAMRTDLIGDDHAEAVENLQPRSEFGGPLMPTMSPSPSGCQIPAAGGERLMGSVKLLGPRTQNSSNAANLGLTTGRPAA